ncbi:MAG TPA: hypothetical protein VNO52_02195 [Methylomirabilota bacterium]|nr:hypothetical protein [Methylomirabilota bacterium]
MSVSRWLWVAWWLLGFAGGASVARAQASPYVPLEHRFAPFVEHLIRAGLMEDPLPLGRPFRRVDVARITAAADSENVPAPARALLRQLQREFPAPGEIHGRAEAYVGAAAGSYARRDALRQEGTGILAPRGGFVLEGVWRSLVASTHQLVDERLHDDPDYRGRKDRWTAGRGTDAYLGAQGRFGELIFGALSRNWGPPGIPGTVISWEPYSYDHLFVRVGVPRLRLEATATELDPMDIAGQRVRRFWSASRLVASPTRWLTGAVTQGALWSGVGRGGEPWWLNPLKTSATTQSDEADTAAVNSLYAATVRVSLPRKIVLYGDLLVDDLSSILSNSNAPDRIAATVVADVPFGGTAVARVSYTMVASLTYRSSQGLDQALMRRGVGLGRNYADYDQVSAEVSFLPSSHVLLTPQLAWLRQGEGDFRRPFPPLPAEDHPLLFEGTVERTLRVGLTGVATVGRTLSLAGDVGLHAVRNAAHVRGATASDLVWRITASYHLDLTGELPR